MEVLFKMETKNILKALCNTKGVSGNEKNACDTALDFLREYCPDAYIKNSCVIGTFGEFIPERKTVLLDAHIDQIGLILTYITDEGFIKFDSVGGIDIRLLPAQQVEIHGRKNIKGIVCSVPPHLLHGGSDVPEIASLAIDTGYSKAELEKLVSQGDFISFCGEFEELIGDRVTGLALDDRCGVAAILHALRILGNKKLNCNVKILFSSQEELGERGAKISAFDINPDIAIAVDVSFGYVAGEDEYKCGKLEKGAMIGISPSLSREISDALIKTAEINDIPYQIEVMSGLTSTNADQFSVNRSGAKACTVSVPLKYMHTPVEIISMKDVEFTGQLIAEYLKGVK